MCIGGAVGLVFVRQAPNEGLLLTATDKNTIGSAMVKASVPPSPPPFEQPGQMQFLKNPQ
jgi:hypothetical protein